MGNYPPLCDAIKARLEDFQFLLRYKLHCWLQPSLTEIKTMKDIYKVKKYTSQQRCITNHFDSEQVTICFFY